MQGFNEIRLDSKESIAQREARFVLEHIQQAFLGEEVPITCAFNDYGIAKAQRISGRIDYVAVKWDFSLYIPKIVFDPNCSNGTIVKLLCLYVYSKVIEAVRPPEPKKVDAFFTKSSAKMSGEELKFELKMIHGLSDEKVAMYKSMPSRVAKVVEMRKIADNGRE